MFAKILSQKWQLIKVKEPDDIFLSLTSQFKNEKEDFSMSKPELEGRLAASEQARNSYLKALNECRELTQDV